MQEQSRLTRTAEQAPPTRDGSRVMGCSKWNVEDREEHAAENRALTWLTVCGLAAMTAASLAVLSLA